MLDLLCENKNVLETLKKVIVARGFTSNGKNKLARSSSEAVKKDSETQD